MRAAVLNSFHAPLDLQEVEILGPRPGEVQVRIAASGLCGSDVKVIDGKSPIAPQLPMILGHEAAGVVEDVGDGTSSVARGDHVVIALYGPCGRCVACQSGDLPRCDGPTRASTFGLMADGTTRLRIAGREARPFVGIGSFAERSIVHETMVVKVDPRPPLSSLALLGCGVITGVGAVFNTAQVRPGSSVAVIGCGGVGLNVIQGAQLAGAARIVAVDTNPQKLAWARTFGATDEVLSDGGAVADRVREAAGGGVDYAFEAIGAAATVAEAFASTADGGTTVMVGSPPPGVVIPVDGRLLFSDRRLLGCQGGAGVPARDIPMLVDLYLAGRLKLDQLVTARFPLEGVNAAVDAFRRGEVARAVITLDES